MSTARFSESGDGGGGGSAHLPTGEVCPWGRRPWQTNACENITLPETSFVGGNKETTVRP